ncbi:SAM-dependent methyltransferase [Sulfurimonas crateris]|uniref:SAM-dependent methyltransferase n=1 Tax=Sulfurimonas crateris TaxID=2574727 RepID=A0A4U2Z883_9BACT|nr:N-6 DNA methylase [Sulfurimonas crateris]TKI70274.1 SAM-dependent methyltransferase [Sulfurimonas crateris]
MKQIEFGDFQTPNILTEQVIQLLSNELPTPNIVIEPTCGLGNFIEEAYNEWNDKCKYFGFEINSEYYELTKNKFAYTDNIKIKSQNFFSFDWNSFFKNLANKEIAIIGNPPWVSNSTMGNLDGNNLPKKSNFQKLKGFDAKTGKSNFDIAEWIIIELIESTKLCTGYLAFLCKTATARKILTYFWKKNINIGEANLYLINAKKDFNVSVDACLFVVNFSTKDENKYASVYSSLVSDKKLLYKFGMYKEQLISNLTDYKQYEYLDGFSSYTWRSGIKHDASKVMELTLKNDELVNGFGEVVDIEDTYIYPLLKSSDIGNSRLVPRRFVIVTQRKVGEDTSIIETIAPKTWEYLNQHISKLNNRKSSIYKNKPLFSIFGIGKYSFSNWKVGISGLYKNITFCTIPPYQDKPIMLDDTCYFIPCNSEEEAKYWTKLLNSDEMKKFLHSLIFIDAKRPVTVDILKRINMASLSKKFAESEIANKYLKFSGMETRGQASFVFEQQPKYLTTPSTEQ